VVLFLKFFLLNNIINFPYPLKSREYQFIPDFKAKKIFYLKKANGFIDEPDSVYEYLKKFLEISDFEDSIKVLPLYLLAGIELKREKLSDYERYFKYFKPELKNLLLIFENIDKKYFENISFKDTFLYYAYILNAINFKKNIDLPYVKEEPYFLYSYSYMKFNSGKIKDAEKFLKKFISNRKNYFNELYDDALYILSLIERFRGNENREMRYLLKLKNEFPGTDYKYEVYLRLLTIYFDKGEYSKILEIKKEIHPFLKRLVSYFYAAYVFEGKIDSAEKIIKYVENEERRDSIRYFTSDKLLKRKRYKEAEVLLDFFEDKEKEKYFKLTLNILFLNEREDKLIGIFEKEERKERKALIAKYIADLYMKKENYAESEKYYRISYELKRDDSVLYSLLFAELKSGKIREEELFEKFISSAQDTFWIKKIRTDYHFYLKEHDKFRECEKNLLEVLNILKDEDEMKFYLKEFYEIERFVKNDSIFLNILLEKGKNNLSSFAAFLALKYMIERGFPEEEIFSFISNFKINEDEFGRKIFFNLSKLYLNENKVKEAKVLLKDLLSERDSVSDKAILLLGDIAISEGNISLLDTVIDYLSPSISENNPYLFYFLAEREKLKGNVEKAVDLFEKAAESFKEDRDSAARMLLKAALISPQEKKDYFFKRAMVLAEDENLKREIEEIWKKEMF